MRPQASAQLCRKSQTEPDLDSSVRQRTNKAPSWGTLSWPATFPIQAATSPATPDPETKRIEMPKAKLTSFFYSTDAVAAPKVMPIWHNTLYVGHLVSWPCGRWSWPQRSQVGGGWVASQVGFVDNYWHHAYLKQASRDTQIYGVIFATPQDTFGSSGRNF